MIKFPHARNLGLAINKKIMYTLNRRVGKNFMKQFKENAFTLIELLAVIIILAIVALIATPIILNVIEDARISAGRSEANMILGGINNYCASEDMKYQLDNNYERICTSDMDINDVPTMVNLGNATINEIVYDGEKLTTLVIESNNHKFTLCPSGTFAMDDEECDGEVAQSGNLISTLLGQYQEGNTTGLLKDATNENLYYYKGTNAEVANNFLWYGGHQWRVIEFDTEEKTLTLITQQPLTAIQPASAVWESEQSYIDSYINKWLNDYFLNSLDSSIQATIQKSTFNIGIYNNVSEFTTTQKVGLLDEEQYKRAGEANSFLDIKDWWWLGNRYSSSYVRCVGDNGNAGYVVPTSTGGVRAVIKISDITITEGNDGTLASNYQLGNKATDTNNVQVGEYINVPYSGSDNACGSDNMCTFKVVSKDEDSIKVVLNGLLPNESEYGSSTTISTSHTIYTPLSTFAAGISDTYRYTGNKTFYIGDYPSSATNYKDVQDEILDVSVGLPTVGEMFSGNDIDLSTSSTKTFVDVNTIENPTASNNYWTMNRYSSSDVRCVDNYGFAGYFGPTYAPGVRAVIYLKSGTSAITFAGGEGTPNSPYELSQ